ncbi:hypothetical protein P691DRAFT_739850 [Macrolepiota fuliginosa MF-IS2]|uniref:Fungal-type protein kinase domain-containing protein n=1 Tax=Macrolepiota fuliginosa MF-IS2 TaxID=1400762 RepID=A0A9P5WZ44_9AGAR|nr:hypothetical protein P691DRAFT_739850 [Macrolepiota fuliginosa MF-IS2]
MASEMYECPLKNFLADYAPFHPSRNSINAAVQHYTNTEKSNGHPDSVTWTDLQLRPSDKKRNENENQVFAHLQAIIDDLRQLECFEEGVNEPRRPQFYYLSCPNNWIASEIEGTNFRVDACIGSNPDSKTIILTDTAVVAEFKKSGKTEGLYQNHKQLVSAVSQIMNGDPRRTWIYGITIEDTMMSVWYFCRSHSDIKSFIEVFMSFLYATPEEIGYDPTIRRQLYENKFHYIYELKTDKGPKYFRTIEPLFNSRALCITGRKTRVWRAIEVRDAEDFAAKDGTSEIALKDVWLEVDAETEKQNQDQVFDALNQLDENAYSWLTGYLYDRLKEAIQDKGYRDYFMEIKYDTVLPGTKPLSTAATAAPNLLRNLHDVVTTPVTTTTMSMKASGDVVSNSSQTNAPSGLSDRSTRLPGKPHFPRVNQARKHYRLIYGQVGHSLNRATNLDNSFTAIVHAFIALILLYLARWVHRDVSVGNIILVVDENGVRGKLSDLEYAKEFGANSAGGDPKTGTPFFMPVEVHDSRPLRASPPLSLEHSAAGSATPLDTPPEDKRPPLRVLFRFQHDLESLWWIIVWILLCRVKGGPETPLPDTIFAPTYTPTHGRIEFFMLETFKLEIRGAIHPRLHGSIDSLNNIRAALYNFCVSEETFYKADDPVVYIGVYNEVWKCLVYLVQQVRILNKELPLDGEAHSGTDPQAGQSHTRPSVPEDNGPPSKKAKTDSGKEDGR